MITYHNYLLQEVHTIAFANCLTCFKFSHFNNGISDEIAYISNGEKYLSIFLSLYRSVPKSSNGLKSALNHMSANDEPSVFDSRLISSSFASIYNVCIDYNKHKLYILFIFLIGGKRKQQMQCVS